MARLLFLQNLEHEYLGPMYISSMVRSQGHECRLALGHALGDFESELTRFKPDLVGFSVMSGSHPWALRMAQAVKKEFGIRNIFGGAHPTFFPEFIEQNDIDMILRGEGEESVAELLNRIDTHQSLTDIPNVWCRNGALYRNDVRPLRQHLDDYPFPDRALYDGLEGKLDRTVRNVITSRGCPWRCSFCFEEAQRELYRGKGKYVRLRSIDKVIEECLELRRLPGVACIYFADDVFGLNKKWTREFLLRYRREVGLPFICLVRADMVASDVDYAERLAEGGCKTVFFGLESGDEALRNVVLAKHLTNVQIETAAARLHDAGIPFRTFNMMALPGETVEQAYSTVELNIRIKTDYPWCSIATPFPGTAFHEYAVAHGHLRKDFHPDELARSFFADTALTDRSATVLENLHKFFQTAVLWPWTFPLIKRLITLPPNVFFRGWFALVYFFVYLRSERRRFWPTLKFGIRNYRHLMAKR